MLTTDFHNFYSEHVAVVRSVLFHLCGESELDDLTQEVFIKAWSGHNKFQGKSSLKTWMYRISVNTGLDYLRKNVKKSIKDKNREVGHNDGIQDYETTDLVSKGLELLPEKQRVVLVLFAIEELTIQEIAEILKTRAGTVKSRLHYAKEKFSVFLKNNGVEL